MPQKALSMRQITEVLRLRYDLGLLQDEIARSCSISEALSTRRAFQSLSQYDQGSVIEFLKTLQILLPGTKELLVVASRDDD